MSAIVTGNGVRPTLLSMILMMLAEPLESTFHVPASLTLVVTGLGLLGWFGVYGIAVWQETAQNKKELDAKHAKAVEQLSIC